MKSIQLLEMLEGINYSRRDFLGEITISLAAAGFGVFGATNTQTSNAPPMDATKIKPGTSPSSGQLKEIAAGVLNERIGTGKMTF
ncbi:MAG TPA: twin-arginine translocation signal domain-containing protein [Candidatus Acidoferrales bacterium]|jgi:hypothetical protein|nr:twin-arginine translocation signal domain-containing protein [Candidatus Acidoferrales bacterium]